MRPGTLTALPLLIVLCGCLSEPLGPPGAAATDVRLLGKWRCFSAGEDTKRQATLEVMRFDDAQYYAEWTEGVETSRYRAYSTRVDATSLLNVKEINGRFTPWPWAILRADIAAEGGLTLKLVDGKALRSTDAQGRLAEITARVRDDVVPASSIVRPGEGLNVSEGPSNERMQLTKRGHHLAGGAASRPSVTESRFAADPWCSADIVAIAGVKY